MMASSGSAIAVVLPQDERPGAGMQLYSLAPPRDFGR
jgi:hypothetical protein